MKHYTNFKIVYIIAEFFFRLYSDTHQSFNNLNFYDKHFHLKQLPYINCSNNLESHLGIFKLDITPTSNNMYLNRFN